VGCKTPGSLLCQKCWPQVQFMYEQSCPICLHSSIAGRTHPLCRSTWGIDGVTTISRYRGPTRSMIRQLKYSGARVVGELTGQLISRYQENEELLLPPSIITPIPLHSKTFKSRGYNQAEIIAQELSQATGFPLIPDLLVRAHMTASQTKLSKEERRKNIKGVFEINAQYYPKSDQALKGSSVILVDDVFTTGSTLREAAKILKKAGISEVYGFTLAHD